MASSSPHLSHPNYRPDIDGLRAIAVLSVIVFHAFPGSLKGGFVGVDVFFVISGYLISTILFENLERGTFSFAEFYARRIKRIFPALLVVLIACGMGTGSFYVVRLQEWWWTMVAVTLYAARQPIPQPPTPQAVAASDELALIDELIF